MHGLESALQRGRLAAIRCSDTALDRSRASMSEVRAPADDIDFALEAARLEIEVRAQGAPVAGADVQIEASDTHWMRTTDDAGRVALSVSPANAYVIGVHLLGYEPARQFVRGLANGESAQCTLDLD